MMWFLFIVAFIAGLTIALFTLSSLIMLEDRLTKEQAWKFNITIQGLFMLIIVMMALGFYVLPRA